MFAVVSLSLVPIQRRLGVRTLVWGVALQLIALVGFLLVSFIAWGPSLIWWAQPALVLLGAGQALVFSPLAQAVVREVPVEAAGLSGGMFSTVQQLALSLGVIAIGAVTTATGWSGREEVVAGFVLDAVLACGVLAVALVLTAAAGRGHR
ncbi:Major Facilitator Superfamily protein [Microbacterium laevaniformans]|uniref:Major Facilitator Superfamily protein n=1 Tax=Microbacterium laevaniformans TaxID=36807 RepID=A0A150HE57_9MICO|nr:MFS transporter [Microbacterium laevaniformans]KXZ60413.1 Major Facilitator Superfamily protein [Microbacterium laevaniformans]